MDLLQMDYFVKVADNVTMQQAAERLNVSPSTLSMSVKKLETELDTRLFRRSGHGLILTEEGRLFYEGASRILFEVDALKQRLRSAGEKRRNSVIVATDAVDYATETLYLYSEFYPDRKVEHIRVRHTAMSSMLLSGQADLCLTLRPVIDEMIESTLLLSEPMYLLSASDSRYEGMSSVCMRDILDETLVCLPKGHALRELFESYFSMLGYAPRSFLEVGELEAISMSVRKRFGVTFVPQCVQGKKDFAADFGYGVCSRPMQESFCYRNLYLSRRKNAVESGELGDYLKFLEKFNDLVVHLKRFPEKEEYLESATEVAPGNG